ncbi:sensor histidine kinase [Paractinoplanes rishiriensis]|uniref:Oxygen sensor histidine kinase NreB n=1 Tax=Paractinoplanes rishiriensis TaxID=1050105 RepID=A0A919JPZ2_9ACTN|nr:sensor histidine kinase [Actinoplanes rishiriensis]GIE92745.1 histidine kinase [Actinoplanes rishiriensis]
MSDIARLEQWRNKVDRKLLHLPYAALACSVALLPAGAAIGAPRQPWQVIASVVAVTVAWLFYFVDLRPRWDDRRRAVVFFAGLTVLTFALVWCSPLFGFFSWCGYLFTSFAFRTRIAQIAGNTFAAMATALAQVGGFWILSAPEAWGFFGIVLLFNLVIANSMALLTDRIDRQTTKRAMMIDELAEANEKLAAVVQENAGLHAQLLIQAREAGVLDERQRMAGEIHDVLAQGLTGIVTQLEAADAAADRSADFRRHLDTAKRLARDSLTEARRSVQALRPQTLDTAELPEAIGEVVTAWSGLHDVSAELITTGTPRALLPEIETTLLRTAQEALANVARHAAAGRVALTLSYMEDVVTLDVRDDGAGFDPEVPRLVSAEGGYGLAAMRERLLRIAGTLEIESEPGTGTALSACVPAIPVGAAA